MKVVLLIWYSNKNFGFRKIESYLASKIDFEIWKCPIFASSASNCLTKYKQILSGCSLGCKYALNFTRLIMKLHNHGHTTVHHQIAIVGHYSIYWYTLFWNHSWKAWKISFSLSYYQLNFLDYCKCTRIWNFYF